MSSINQIASDLYKVMSESDERAVKPYDVKAEVLRQEGEIVWVKIPGGVDETPVQKTNNANPGDNVMVRIAGGRAWLLGNETSPATDDTVANAATQLAEGAGTLADLASQAANDAQVSAQIAYNYADQAKQGADRAGEQAQIATGYASDAKASAIAANIASNSALTQLSVVEDVASVLTWISEHGTYKLSADTAVISGKLYFTRSGTDPDYEYSLITEPTGNPHTNNYYEIDTLGDESVSNYISSHLALTNAGLWVVNDNSSYKILLASDGMKVYDSMGNLVSSFGESITFSSNRAQYIGGENAYIVFNPVTGAMTIGGSDLNISGNVTIGGRTRSLSEILSDMQSEIDGSIETWYYTGAPTLSNEPAVNWTTDAQKNQHLRDLYFDTSTGHTYRWAYENNQYKWIQIEDTEASAALALAQQAKDSADSKISDVVIEYAKSTSPTSQPTSGWSSNTPTWEEGKYIWQRTAKTVNGSTTYTYTCIQGAKGNTGDSGEDAVVLRIDSSRGTVFKNNQVSTVLTVTIFSGSDIINNLTALHSKFGNTAYLQWYWQKIDESDYGIIVSTDHKLSNDGFTLTLTPDEVDVKVTFRCELLI